MTKPLKELVEECRYTYNRTRGCFDRPQSAPISLRTAKTVDGYEQVRYLDVKPGSYFWYLDQVCMKLDNDRYYSLDPSGPLRVTHARSGDGMCDDFIGSDTLVVPLDVQFTLKGTDEVIFNNLDHQP